ncbi:UNVERIFIED_CONTAM: putative methyltransferase PMT18 [Sesamum angustifolium]|uniref:Methyltransferase n=1 Tax=Sesamum angustifolium TaxID=2727405 RepID=A0AAW2M6Z1_9LAMI
MKQNHCVSGIMAKDYGGSPKPHQLDMKRKRLTWILAVSGLCVLFYVFGAWQGRSPTPSSQSDLSSKVGCDVRTGGQGNRDVPSSSAMNQDALDFESHHELSVNSSQDIEKFPPCDISYSEYTPCEDQQRTRALTMPHTRSPNYKRPFKWPQSRDYAWYANIPHKELSIEKAVQNWIQVEGDRFRFPGGGTMFANGADVYIDDINALIPITDGSIRTALDTGCGVASWGAYLLKRDIVAMSFAPRDTHEAQVWFALERGVPAMIAILSSKGFRILLDLSTWLTVLVA